MFNKTMRDPRNATPSTYEGWPVSPPEGWAVNDWRANRTSAWTNQSIWTPWDMEHDTSIRTPKIFYSRWTYRRKSLGSAITNVFVATFTMVAAIWKIFSFIAGLVISKVDDLAASPSELENEVRELREEIASIDSRTEVRALQEEMQRMMRYPASKYRLSLADMGDSTLTESLLSSVDHDSKEEAWNGSRDGYDRV
ncbi:hypothetical protein BDZ89DRAFT_1068996 [Hymenopellis radicata]|nr:hypothetical protein BDZ89DRAFT_1068996 [Hymenopellis radicata]